MLVSSRNGSVKFWFTSMLLSVGCVAAPDVDSSEAMPADASTGDETDAPQTTEGGGENTSGGDSGGSESSSGGDGGSTGCGDDCGEDPELAWLTVTDFTYGDGRCLTAIPDGGGGVIGSFRGSGLYLTGDVLSVDADGENLSFGGAAEGITFPALALRAPGLFDWASFEGEVGIADTTTVNLAGGPLAPDVSEIRAVAKDGERLRYLARVGPHYDCVLRVGADPQTDSVPFACADRWSREEVHQDGMGNWYYFDPLAYRVLRVDPAGLQYGNLDGRWNRVPLDGAVDGDGRVWFAGAIGSDPYTVFGSFVARHGFDLAQEPQWELAEEGDVVWDAIATTQDRVIVVGHQGYGERLVGMGLTLEGETTWTWEHEPAPRTYVDAMAIDEAGDVVACGIRFLGEEGPAGPEIRYAMFMKLSL